MQWIDTPDVVSVLLSQDITDTVGVGVGHEGSVVALWPLLVIVTLNRDFRLCQWPIAELIVPAVTQVTGRSMPAS